MTKVLIILAAALALVACSTPQFGGGSGASGAAEGGKASSTPVDTTPNVAFAQPTGSATAIQVKNSDTTSNPVAGDAPILVLGGGAAAAKEMLAQADPVGDAITDQYKLAQTHLEQATTPEDRDFWMARADAQITALAAHTKERYEAAKGIAGDFSSLQTVVFYVVSLRLAGVPPEKLPSATVEALAKGIGEAIKPALVKGGTQ